MIKKMLDLLFGLNKATPGEVERTRWMMRRAARDEARQDAARAECFESNFARARADQERREMIRRSLMVNAN